MSFVNRVYENEPCGPAVSKLCKTIQDELRYTNPKASLNSLDMLPGKLTAISKDMENHYQKNPSLNQTELAKKISTIDLLNFLSNNNRFTTDQATTQISIIMQTLAVDVIDRAKKTTQRTK